jgi:hypothetical protein
MFKILKEITVWNCEYTVYNHFYLLDPKSRILAYYNVKDKTIHQLKSPYVIDKRYRKFIETKHTGLSKLIPKNWQDEERQEKIVPSDTIRVFKVKSKSKNKTYEVIFNTMSKQVVCGCTGFGYRNTCSHAKAVSLKLGV